MYKTTELIADINVLLGRYAKNVMYENNIPYDAKIKYHFGRIFNMFIMWWKLYAFPLVKKFDNEELLKKEEYHEIINTFFAMCEMVYTYGTGRQIEYYKGLCEKIRFNPDLEYDKIKKGKIDTGYAKLLEDVSDVARRNKGKKAYIRNYYDSIDLSGNIFYEDDSSHSFHAKGDSGIVDTRISNMFSGFAWVEGWIEDNDNDAIMIIDNHEGYTQIKLLYYENDTDDDLDNSETDAPHLATDEPESN